jgi:hypothetical protein
MITKAKSQLDFLTRWAAAVIQASQAGVFGGKPVQIMQVETVSGPRAGALEIHAGIDSGRLLKNLQADECALHRQFIPWRFEGEPSVYMTSRYVRLEAGWPDELAEKNITLASIGQHPHDGGRWIAGKNEQGATITLGLDSCPHYLIGGWTGSGKTYALRSAMAQLAQDETNQLVLIDCKYGDGLGCLSHLPNLAGPVATDFATAKNALSWSVGDMKRRYETKDKTKRLIIVIDEIQEITGKTGDAAVIEMVRKLVAQGRGARVHVLIGTQHPVNDVFSDPTIRRNLTGRLALKVSDYKSSEVITGGSFPRADRLLGQGDAYAIVGGAIHRAQLAYIPGTELAKITGAEPSLKAWPDFDAEQLDNIPSDTGFTGGELAVSLVAAHYGKGRPFLKDALDAAGLVRPGNEKAARLLSIGKETYTWLVDSGFSLCAED